MKTIKFLFKAVFVLFLLFSCKEKVDPEIISVNTTVTQTNNEYSKTKNLQNYATANFTIRGMSCEIGCARAIEKKLSKLDGVYKAAVNFQKEMATVKFDPNIIDEALLTSAVISGSKTPNYSVEEFKINMMP